MTTHNSIRLTLVLACLLFKFVETAHCEDRSLVPSHFAILGLIIGDCSSQDVYSRFGPGIPFRHEAKADVTQVCYVSDKDETLVSFSFENSRCSQFRLLSQKTQFYKWHFCEKSPLVSKQLATESSIKLGMSKSSLIAILGVPQGESDDELIHFYELKQKRNTAQTARDAAHPTNKPLKVTTRTEFSDTGLILFDVSQSLP